MKNETIVLIVAFIGILYIMFHHNQTVSGAPSNTSQAFGAVGTSGIGASPFTCTGPTCRGGAPGIDLSKITGPGGPYVDPHSGGGDASIRTPGLLPIRTPVAVSQIAPSPRVFTTWTSGSGTTRKTLFS